MRYINANEHVPSTQRIASARLDLVSVIGDSEPNKNAKMQDFRKQIPNFSVKWLRCKKGFP